MSPKDHFNVRKYTTLAFLLSLSLVLAYLDSILPSFLPNPAFKIGLSQIPILIAFSRYNLKTAGFLSLGKVVLMSLILGYFFTLLFWINLLGSIGSILFLALAQKFRFSLSLSSVFSSLGHNLGQFLVLGLSVGFMTLRLFLPLILLYSILFGLLTGVLAGRLLRRLP